MTHIGIRPEDRWKVALTAILTPIIIIGAAWALAWAKPDLARQHCHVECGAVKR